MGITIDKISDNEQFEYKGDVHITGSIGQGATVIIKDGNLVVDGDINQNTEIKLESDSNVSFSTNSIVINNMTIGNINTSKMLNVKGNIYTNVSILSASADLLVEGNIGRNCKFKTQSGDIKAANVEAETSLKTMSGDIKVGNVGSNSTLKTMSGDIKAAFVEHNSSLETMSGDVKVQNAHSSVTLKTMSGDIYENGVKRKKSHSNHSSSFSIGNMSFIGSGRIVVNGRDITDIVNREANRNTNQAPEEKPVRYFKQ